MKGKILPLFVVLVSNILCAQNKEQSLPAKVSHAEPIYFDLIRDLGARKGERELNLGMGVATHASYSEFSYLIEYEFAPINRLGLEVEVPLSFYNRDTSGGEPGTSSGIEGIKAAMQYSFFVSEKLQTTMAAGYILERRLSHSLSEYEHMPFFIVAKSFKKHWHTMLYSGPSLERNHTGNITVNAIANVSLHYVIPGTHNFVGIEVNDEMEDGINNMVIRPQIKMALSSTSYLGISLGVTSRHAERLQDFMIRWIYEPKKKK